MWTNLLRLDLNRTRICLDKLRYTKSFTIPLSTSPDYADIIDSSETKSQKQEQIQQPQSNERYFKAIAQNSNTHTRSIEDIDLNRMSDQSTPRYNSNYIEKASIFAKEVLMFPNKPKFREVQTRTLKRDRHYPVEGEKYQVKPKKYIGDAVDEQTGNGYKKPGISIFAQFNVIQSNFE